MPPTEVPDKTLTPEAEAVPIDPEDAPPPNDDAEAAALADARERGEANLPTPPAKAAENEEEPEEKSGAVPSLEELRKKLSSEVLDALEDLFRARWQRVIRVRKKDLPEGKWP